MTILIEKVEARMAIKRTYSELVKQPQPRWLQPWHCAKSKSSQRKRPTRDPGETLQ